CWEPPLLRWCSRSTERRRQAIRHGAECQRFTSIATRLTERSADEVAHCLVLHVARMQFKAHPLRGPLVRGQRHVPCERHLAAPPRAGAENDAPTSCRMHPPTSQGNQPPQSARVVERLLANSGPRAWAKQPCRCHEAAHRPTAVVKPMQSRGQALACRVFIE